MLPKAGRFSCSSLKREVSGVRSKSFVRGRKVASKGEQLGLHVRGNDVDLATGVGNGNLKGRSRELRHDGDVPLIVKVADADTLCEAPLVDLFGAPIRASRVRNATRIWRLSGCSGEVVESETIREVLERV